MVQMVSLPDKMEVKTTKQTEQVSSNTDFLELLLKDIKKDENTENQDLDDDELVEIKDILDKTPELKQFINEDSFESKTLVNQNTFKEESVREIKNILDSKMKQENILLTKAEIKEFKKIDNLKDLIKFADKKGLNITSIKIDTEKVVDKSSQNKNSLESLNLDTDIKQSKTPKLLTKDILIPKANIQKDNIKHSKSENVKVDDLNSDKKDKQFSLESILGLKTKNDKHTEKISKHNVTNSKMDKDDKIKKDIDSNKLNLNKTTKVDELEIDKSKPTQKSNNKNNVDLKLSKDNDNKEIKAEIDNVDKHSVNKNIKTQKSINLDSLLNPNKTTKMEEKPKLNEMKMDNNVNFNQPMVNEIKAKQVQAKEVIKHFNNNLDEAIKNYKPPVSKVNIELNPKNLGKVEVSIVQRGNNIQVHMNTDQSNVALFQNHQAEFRQALSNIGFSNIDMSFNSNQSQDKERKQNQAKKEYKENEDQEVGEIEIKANYMYA